ncbi:pyridoxamine 5'-phosphate oxidase family protein [Candidatus Nomurabacteria bacterium]|nr:pyridoxamine 5'-phosphate oxidase family protein [Candidatus Kaiserbacteria bacterium]MCB9814386.1 pyridoxamine 5'-phosphate oxidase family protein [Candidatus Nomurabacteria bacterium]
MLTKDIIDALQNAEARALATTGPHGINVVPFSVIDVSETEIHLFNFFMSKTVENLKENKTVALIAWSGLAGIQIKGEADYVESGEMFDSYTKEMKERFPERTLHGIITIKPSYLYDVSAGSEAGRLLKSPADFLASDV